jgi:glycosyltransferase involved in cell wall biosynthesis
LRVGIDYTSAAHQGAGIGRLTRNIVRALAQIEADESHSANRVHPANGAHSQENEYKLLVQGRALPYGPGTPDEGHSARNVASGIPNDNFCEVRTWISERWWTRIWHRLHLPIPVEWLIGEVDLFHGPDFTLPPLRPGTRAILTVHDLSFLHLPRCFEPALLDYLVANVPRAVERADWVLADSESTRQDVIELLKMPAERVSVLYPGVEARFRPMTDARALERVRAKYGLPERFVLSVGTIQPRKNYVRLIEALACMEAGDVSVVIVGGKGWLYQDLFDRIQDQRLGERVIFPGYVEDKDLPAVYNLADAFALPSLYEGFGIPPLEAMSCGTPVVVADNSSLPEVAGDAALLVDAEDTEALADALTRVLSDSMLRQGMIERGIRQASRFTWQEAARTLRSTYEHVGHI